MAVSTETSSEGLDYNSSFYAIDFALARRLQRFLAVHVLDGNTTNLLVR